MRVTRLTLDGETVAAAEEEVLFEAVAEIGGEPVIDAAMAHMPLGDGATALLVRIATGGSFPLHSGPERGFVQVIRGAGVLELPGGVRLPFRAPELFLFDPDTLHAWRDISEDTLLAACIVG